MDMGREQQDAPLWIAQEQGFFARQDLDVQLVMHEV
jgi:ABC-type nitrate/sulfonate/bicarbonate transport system substrate-binding protein